MPTERSAVLNAPLGQGFRSDSQLWEMPVLPGQSVEELVPAITTTSILLILPSPTIACAAAVPNDQFYGVCGVCLISMPRPLGTRGPIVVRLSWV